MLFLKAILHAISKIRAQIVHKIRMFFAPDFHTFSLFFIDFVIIVPLWSITLSKQVENPEMQVYEALLHSKAADFRRKSPIFHVFGRTDIKTEE